MPSDAKERLNQVQKAGNKITKTPSRPQEERSECSSKFLFSIFLSSTCTTQDNLKTCLFICIYIYVYKVSENCTTKLTKKKKIKHQQYELGWSLAVRQGRNKERRGRVSVCKTSQMRAVHLARRFKTLSHIGPTRLWSLQVGLRSPVVSEEGGTL